MKAAAAFFAAICLILVSAFSTSAQEPQVESSRIVITYVPPKDSAHQAVYELLQEYRALEKLQDLLSPIRLPRPLQMKVEGCDGESNAWYENDTVTVCYEYIDEIWRNAPKKTTRAGLTPIDALLGPLFDVFLHETGHALFDLLKIPVFGREEDAADQVSAYLMLHLGKAESRRLILGTAYAYKREFEASTALLTFVVSGLLLIAGGALIRAAALVDDRQRRGRHGFWYRLLRSGEPLRLASTVFR